MGYVSFYVGRLTFGSAGQERFAVMAKNFSRDAHGLIIMYDVNTSESFDTALQLLQECEGDAPIMLLGNKIDLEHRCISTHKGKKLAKRFNALFFEVSVATFTNIETAFKEFIVSVLQKTIRPKAAPTEQHDFLGWVVVENVQLDQAPSKVSSKCCFWVGFCATGIEIIEMKRMKLVRRSRCKNE